MKTKQSRGKTTPISDAALEKECRKRIKQYIKEHEVDDPDTYEFACQFILEVLGLVEPQTEADFDTITAETVRLESGLGGSQS